MNPKFDKEAHKIYLTGFMGSGKSTVGPRVAERVRASFLDLDAAIEAQAGRSIPALFAEAGEAGFRRHEAQALQAASAARGRVVVATGGGTLVREDNLRHALERGTVVYLRVPARVLAGRLREAAGSRPLLQDAQTRPLSGAALTERIETLLGERAAFYERAHLTIDATHDTPGETAGAVVDALQADSGAAGD